MRIVCKVLFGQNLRLFAGSAIESGMSPNQHEFDQDWDLSEGLDPEGPSAQDLDRFGDEVDPCPNCGAMIYDQAEICPKCGWYLGEVPKSVSLWVVLGVCGLIVVLLGFMF